MTEEDEVRVILFRWLETHPEATLDGSVIHAGSETVRLVPKMYYPPTRPGTPNWEQLQCEAEELLLGEWEVIFDRGTVFGFVQNDKRDRYPLGTLLKEHRVRRRRP